ncbi:anthranilate phosphoribosyltransferase [Campylobacter fetus subsp. testudinum]|uniref:Anthranilate phosphoribosyltransferase n=1 Tax=Campylobacter fetus subsp. testudinum TaxID=1507806 RepID=A0AAX0HB60_CAMFE|nr:anthranilate phosphoribosyltransferase [Campylobacter fetus]AVK80695.1 anthranilate phosphoribosyltransferase [Campylobacter fetus subsp. testudinum]OCR90796.1 anthranilate synthase [Campylobacter fetus subsp. testudinum]OCS00214.1 anthranilate phosphoribosyltransferase [Campylobacter fetus subsp. testudinum]
MILMIDNYDSFVYNIYQYILETTDEEVRCVRNDEITMEAINALNPSKIILSPGPKHPSDSGVCLDILSSNLDIPILGVCLGHQAIGLSFGADIKRLENPMHGKSSVIKILHNSGIFKDLPNEFNVMRYHSLYVDNLPKCLEITAFSDDGIIMGLKHKSKQIYGIQFHPESYFTEYGKKIIENFVNLNKPKKKEKEVVDFAPFMTKLQKGFPLESGDYEVICKEINDKNYDIVQLAGLLVLISEKSLYPDSLAALVKNILKYSITYSDSTPMFDIVGTGGDKLKTINISTTVAFILASMGVKVAKHGNRAITSKSGSSDLLNTLGVPLNSDIGELRETLNLKNLAFFHAPFFHKITAEVKEVRNRLGIGTVFNMLGPLLNPNLNLTNQIAGNYLEEVNELMARTLLNLGRKHALVVHGMDGMDEITLCDETLIHEVKDGKILEYKITPEQFGFNRAFHADIEGGDAENNAKIFKSTIKGELSGAKFDIVLINAMFGLYAADFVSSPMDAKPLILEALSSGKVWEFYKDYVGK